MPPTRNPRSSTSRKGTDSNSSQELRICQESGRGYRPFIDPKRIENSDARKARGRYGTKGVPEIHLNVIDLTASSPTTQKWNYNTSNARPSKREFTYNTWSSDQQDTLSVETDLDSLSSASSSRCSPSPSPLPSPRTPITVIKSEYCEPCTLELPPFDHGYQYSTGTKLEGTASNPPSADAFGLNLEDPGFIADAFEIAQNMRLDDMDLSLLNLNMDHKFSATSDCKQSRDAPFVLDTFPCDFLDYDF